MSHYILLGGLFGLGAWVILLEGPGMGGVIFRKDENNNTIFTPKNIVGYLKAPFNEEYFWTNKNFYQHNWILMMCAGAIIGSLFK